MFYGVYYYTVSSENADVKLIGFYDTLQKAKDVLAVIIPNYSPNYGNSVSGGGRIGWINGYEMNAPLQLSCWQPHTSINLFTPSE
jgi:hypothetical protein